jgi:hypothetical protein
MVCTENFKVWGSMPTSGHRDDVQVIFTKCAKTGAKRKSESARNFWMRETLTYSPKTGSAEL